MRLKPSQVQFQQAVISKKYTEILYAGPANTGKSYAAALLFVGIANDIPNCRFGVFRKNLSTSRKTVWHTYGKVINDYRVRCEKQNSSQNVKIAFPNGSVIEFFELDNTKDPDWDKVKSLELTAAHIEEANGVAESGKNILITRIGRWVPNGVHPFVVMTCNPAQGWVRTEFRDPALAGVLTPPKAFIEASPSEMPVDYREMLASSLPPNEFARYANNDWNYADDPNQLIQYEWIKNNLVPASEGAKEFGVDIAREGNDKTVIAKITRPVLNGLEVLDTQDTIAVGDILIARMNELGVGAKNVRVDAIGVGGGTIDYLAGRGYKIEPYKSGYAADEKAGNLLFKNKRAQDYWNLREQLRQNEIKLIDDQDLIKQLVNVRYFVKDKYIQIESKEEIKKRIGVSPDKADAVVIAFAQPYKKRFGFAI